MAENLARQAIDHLQKAIEVDEVAEIFPDEAKALCALLVEADAYISHMLYRGSWPGDRHAVERLIGHLRPASTP